MNTEHSPATGPTPQPETTGQPGAAQPGTTGQPEVMFTDARVQPQSQPWGSAAPRAAASAGAAGKPRRWSIRTAAVVGVTTVAVAVGGGIALAHVANNGTAPTSQGSGPGAGQMPGGPGGMGGAMALASALHGDFVVSDGNGGYATHRLQTGKIAAVSTAAITLASDDGYTRTYVLTAATTVDNGADTISDVKTGDTATVVATISGGTATATTLSDSALVQQNGRPNGQGGPPGNPGQGQQVPTPGATP